MGAQANQPHARPEGARKGAGQGGKEARKQARRMCDHLFAFFALQGVACLPVVCVEKIDPLFMLS